MPRSPRPTRRTPRRPAAASRGVAMVVVLMFMLVLTGVAVFSARYATLGEQMAANQLDQERARQAAEAALRDAERDLLLDGTLRPPNARCDRRPDRPVFDRAYLFSDTCLRGQCSVDTSVRWKWGTGNGANRERWWPTANGGMWGAPGVDKPSVAAGSNTNCTFTGGVPLGTFTGVAELQGVRQQPEYLIEYLQDTSGRSGDVYRITARGFGMTAGTEVVVQSYFQPFMFQ